MSEINDKIFSEFLEVMKRVNVIENNQIQLLTKHNDVLERTTKMLQQFHDEMQVNINSQNKLVQTSIDNFTL
jgi:hypothetical protein